MYGHNVKDASPAQSQQKSKQSMGPDIGKQSTSRSTSANVYSSKDQQPPPPKSAGSDSKFSRQKSSENAPKSGSDRVQASNISVMSTEDLRDAIRVFGASFLKKKIIYLYFFILCFFLLILVYWC